MYREGSTEGQQGVWGAGAEWSCAGEVVSGGRGDVAGGSWGTGSGGAAAGRCVGRVERTVLGLG